MFALPAAEMTDTPNKCVGPACDLCGSLLLLLMRMYDAAIKATHSTTDIETLINQMMK